MKSPLLGRCLVPHSQSSGLGGVRSGLPTPSGFSTTTVFAVTLSLAVSTEEWCSLKDSNLQPAGYEPVAPPIELREHVAVSHFVFQVRSGTEQGYLRYVILEPFLLSLVVFFVNFISDEIQTSVVCSYP